MTNTIAVFQISSEEDLRFQLDFNGLPLAGRALRVSVRERTSNALKVDLVAPTNLTVTGSNALIAFYPRASMSSWAKGIEYEADIIDESGGSATRIMAVRFVYDHPGNLVYGVKGNQASVKWGANQAVITAIGGVGTPGPANVISIGDVDTLETGEEATATLTGSAPTQTLNLGLPKGGTGTAATIAVGDVATVAPGTPATVANSGTSGAAVLDFEIPSGPAATIAVGDVTTVAAGVPAAVANSGTSSAAVFDFDIPAGEKGWTPELATVTDGMREVHQVVDWVGGEGAKPTTGLYVGNTGLVPDIADAKNIRGPQGPSGSVTDGDKGDIVVSSSGSVWTIDAAVLTTAGRALIDDASAADQRATLGLGSGPLSGHRNKLINGDGAINQRGVTAPTDDSYAWDRWNVLTQTAAIGASTLTAPASGVASMMRLTQSQATAQRMGVSQILEAAETYGLRGQVVSFGGKLRYSNAAAVRYAVLEWTGTADAPVSDVVNSWTNGTFTSGQFFNATTLNVLAVGSTTPTANAVTDWSLSATIGSSANNIIVFVWTEGAAAQTSTLDLRCYLVEGAVAGETDPFSPRHRGHEIPLCQRYYYQVSTTQFSSYASGPGDIVRQWLGHPTLMRVSPGFSIVTAPSYVNVSSGIALANANTLTFTLIVTAAGTGGCFFSNDGVYAMSAEL